MPVDRAQLETLERGATALRVPLDERQSASLMGYLALLQRWSRAYNLTAVREPAQMVTRHLLDCLAVAPLVRGRELLDVGSGAGLPGLVLAIVLPQVHATLLEPSLKRTRFLGHAVSELGIANATVVRARLDAFAPPRPVDTVIARASLRLDALLAEAPRLLAPDGRLLAMLGRRPDPMPAAPRGWALELVPLEVPGLCAERHAALMRFATTE